MITKEQNIRLKKSKKKQTIKKNGGGFFSRFFGNGKMNKDIEYPLEFFNKYKLKKFVSENCTANQEELIKFGKKFNELMLKPNMNRQTIVNEVTQHFINEPSYSLAHEILKELISSHGIIIKVNDPHYQYSRQ